jgi:hypothetical protein
MSPKGKPSYLRRGSPKRAIIESPEHSLLQVIDKPVENAEYDGFYPLHYNSVNQDFKERKTQKLGIKREASKKSYLVGKKIDPKQDSYKDEPQKMASRNSDYFSAYGRG